MGRYKYLCLWFLFFGVVSCSKPQAPVNEFDLDQPAREVFSKLVNSLSAQGVGFASVDNGGMTLVTDWKEIEASRLREIAVLEGDGLRYERGRFQLVVVVSESGGRAHVKFDTKMEGFFQGKQQGTSGSGSTGWAEEKSNGTLEKDLLARL